MKEWTPEERAEHGRKIAEAKRKNREKARLQQAYQNMIRDTVVATAPPYVPPISRDTPVYTLTPPKPLTWYDLPKNAIKCARNPLVPRDAPVHKSQCYNCRNEMWTRDDKLENICEVCEFDLVNEKHRLRQEREKARGGVAINPFKQESAGGVVINPFNTGRRLL